MPCPDGIREEISAGTQTCPTPEGEGLGDSIGGEPREVVSKKRSAVSAFVSEGSTWKIAHTRLGPASRRPFRQTPSSTWDGPVSWCNQVRKAYRKLQRSLARTRPTSRSLGVQTTGFTDQFSGDSGLQSPASRRHAKWQ